jgi:hypothetical protein
MREMLPMKQAQSYELMNMNHANAHIRAPSHVNPISPSQTGATSSPDLDDPLVKDREQELEETQKWLQERERERCRERERHKDRAEKAAGADLSSTGGTAGPNEALEFSIALAGELSSHPDPPGLAVRVVEDVSRAARIPVMCVRAVGLRAGVCEEDGKREWLSMCRVSRSSLMTSSVSSSPGSIIVDLQILPSATAFANGRPLTQVLPTTPDCYALRDGMRAQRSAPDGE